MRRLRAAFVSLLVMLCLALPVSAATVVQSLESHVEVAENTDCTVTLRLVLRCDGEVPPFPLPGRAKNVTVNGASVNPTRRGGYAMVDLSRVSTDSPITISYTQTRMVDPKTVDSNGKAIAKKNQKLYLGVSLLCGYTCPIEQMTFTITLPGPITDPVTFSSGYHNEQIMEHMEISVVENRVSGRFLTPLKDRETLSMEMPAENMFPDEVAKFRGLALDDYLLIGFAALSAVFFALFLRFRPTRIARGTDLPAGLTAGQLGGVIIGQGADLTTMVLSWAQLGYLLIHLDDHGRVMLHKRMQMGNERSAFENRCFRALFGRRWMVDASAGRFAQLKYRISASPGVGKLLRSTRRTKPIFRCLSAAVCAVSGVSMALSAAVDSPLLVLAATILGLAGAAAGLYIQQWACYLHLRGRRAMQLRLLAAAAWVLLGLLCSDLITALGAVVWQLLCGYLAAYGGRRTLSGRTLRAQVLGLRARLKEMSPAELARCRQIDPDYFFTMLPAAIALGVEQRFAQHFGSERLSSCLYLTTGMDGHLTAKEWCRVFARAVNAMDAPQKRAVRLFR